MKKEEHWILQEKYAGKEAVGFKKDIERLKAGEPLDYIIGFREFLDCKIDLSKKPLIPRDETEFWVEKAIEDIKEIYYQNETFQKRSISVLDMFAGSGCIGISIMRHIKNAEVTFSEHDKHALEQIEINAKINKLPKKKYTMVKSDVFLNVQGKFDYILANPPYIPETRKNKIQTSVLKYEPTIALFGGGDGLFYIKKFLTEAKNFLNKGGKIYMELDSIQKKGIEKLLKQLSYKNYEFHKDQYGKLRWVTVVD